jgi:hypothetical protein
MQAKCMPSTVDTAFDERGTLLEDTQAHESNTDCCHENMYMCILLNPTYSATARASWCCCRHDCACKKANARCSVYLPL